MGWESQPSAWLRFPGAREHQSSAWLRSGDPALARRLQFCAPRADAHRVTEQTTATASPATSGSAGGTALAAPLVTTALTSAPAPPRPTPTPDTFTFTSPPAAHRTPAPARPAAVRLAPLWTATAVAVTVLTAFFVLIVSGRVVTEGPVVAVLTRTHGIHLGDLFALGLWCAATGALLVNALVTTAAVRGVRR